MVPVGCGAAPAPHKYARSYRKHSATPAAHKHPARHDNNNDERVANFRVGTPSCRSAPVTKVMAQFSAVLHLHHTSTHGSIKSAVPRTQHTSTPANAATTVTSMFQIFEWARPVAKFARYENHGSSLLWCHTCTTDVCTVPPKAQRHARKTQKVNPPTRQHYSNHVATF